MTASADGLAPSETVQVVSAGGVVYRRDEQGIEIVLCGRQTEGLWALPKGSPQAEETMEETAQREVEEETGLAVNIEQLVGSVRYRFTRGDGRAYDKRVKHHLMTPTGGDLSLHDGEYDQVC